MANFRPTRTFKIFASTLILVILFLAGSRFFPIRKDGLPFYYWSVWVGLTSAWMIMVPARMLAARWRLQARVRTILPPANTGTASELAGLVAATIAIKRGEEERALYMLQNMSLKSGA